MGIYVKQQISSLSGATDAVTSGFLNYDDATTVVTPLVVTGGGADVPLTNDALGTATNILFPPTGVTSVWNSVTNLFDWSSLSVGDQVFIRLDISVTTLFNNSDIVVELENGIGGSQYPIPFITRVIKKQGVTQLSTLNMLTINNDNTRLNPSRFIIRSDLNCTAVVKGWLVSIVKKA